MNKYLIVEDDDTTLKILCTMIKAIDENTIIIPAKDAREAMKLSKLNSRP